MKLLFNSEVVLLLIAVFFIFDVKPSTTTTKVDDVTTISTTTTLESVTSELEFTRQDLADLRQVVQDLQRLLKLKLHNSSGATTPSPSPLSSTGGGATYVRWGRTSCPTDSEMVYNGHAAGSHYTHKGGASNLLCVPQEPESLNFSSGLQNDGAFLYGTEYLSHNRLPNFSNLGQNVPCSVCRSLTRSSVIMVPAKTSCYPGWNLEYYGYLMTDHHDHPSGTEYVCVDYKPENVVGGETAVDPRALLYFVEYVCGQSLPCPPFIGGHEVTCAVCTK